MLNGGRFVGFVRSDGAFLVYAERAMLVSGKSEMCFDLQTQRPRRDLRSGGCAPGLRVPACESLPPSLSCIPAGWPLFMIL
jgi:hypothetical protein